MYITHGRFTSSVGSYLSISFLLFNQVDFTLTADAQIWPQSLNYLLGGVADKIYLIVVKTAAHELADFLLCNTFLERFYSVFDTGNKRVGLAQTSFTYANLNFDISNI